MKEFEYYTAQFFTISPTTDYSDLNVLGSQGWELVSIIPCEDPTRRGMSLFFFKRPKAG